MVTSWIARITAHAGVVIPPWNCDWRYSSKTLFHEATIVLRSSQILNFHSPPGEMIEFDQYIFFKRAAQPPTSSLYVQNGENRLPRPFYSTLHLGEITMGFLAKKIRTHEIQRLHPLEKPLGHFERGKQFAAKCGIFVLGLWKTTTPLKSFKRAALPASN